MIRSFNDLYRGALCACQFLTRLPVPSLKDYQAQDSGHALPLFPWVGLIIGLILFVAAYSLQSSVSSFALAALLVTLWAMITGGLHLDGLGDSADGWLSGANGERALNIMKDPRCGSAAVIAIVCLLMLKFAFVVTLLEQHQLHALAIAPLFARAGAISLLLITPYISPKGIGENFLRYSSRTQLQLSTALAGFVCLCLMSLQQFLLVAAISGLLLFGLRRMMIQRVGGATGDTSGALIEILEAALLFGTICLNA